MSTLEVTAAISYRERKWQILVTCLGVQDGLGIVHVFAFISAGLPRQGHTNTKRQVFTVQKWTSPLSSSTDLCTADSSKLLTDGASFSWGNKRFSQNKNYLKREVERLQKADSLVWWAFLTVSRETRTLRNIPDVSPEMSSSTDFSYSDPKTKLTCWKL